MSREYKNILKWKRKAVGKERERNLQKEILSNSSPFPESVTYEDIDEEFRKWCENELYISFEGKELPTMALFTNQRFSEYMQSWQNVDDKKNILLNFKIITRENNPKSGSINGTTRNIPGNHDIVMRCVQARDRNNRRYFIDYRMKQPFSVDINYTVSVVTNKYLLLNEFNAMVNEKFKAITAYIRPKGHFMSMILSDISDESEYNKDDRQFYSQSYNILVRAYIINKDDFSVEERPNLIFLGLEHDQRRSYAEIEDLPCEDPENPYEYEKVIIDAHIDHCDRKLLFNIDETVKITSLEYSDIDKNNLRTFKMAINGVDIPLNKVIGVTLNPGDEIKIHKINRYLSLSDSVLTIIGENHSKVVQKDSEETVFEVP